MTRQYFSTAEEGEVVGWLMASPNPTDCALDVLVTKLEIKLCIRDGAQKGFDVRKLDRAALLHHADRILAFARARC